MSGSVVAGHTSLGEKGRVIDLRDVHIMAGGAVHLAILKTFAGREQSVLVSMYVQGGDAIRIIGGRGKIIQGIPYGKGEGGPKRLA